MKLALSLLCETPGRMTGLTSLFRELVARSVELYPDLEWVLFLGPEQEWGKLPDQRVKVIRDYPANDQLRARLIADHLKVGRRAKKEGCNALITVGFRPFFCPLPNVMHVLTLHHLRPENQTGFARTLYRKWAVARGLKRSELIVTNTQYAVAEILREAPEIKPKLIQSYEGLQHEEFFPGLSKDEEARLEKEFSLRPDYLFWCSNFYPYKQAELLMDSYAQLPPELRAKYPLIMAGGGKFSDGLTRALNRAAELGISEHVRHLGWVPDDALGALFRGARAFVLPSREETFGRCVLEAMACGVPCIVHHIDVMREVTEGHAIITDFSNIPAASEDLRKILTNESLREQLIAGGLRRAGHFSFRRLSIERIEAIRKLLKSPPTPLAKEI